MFILTTRVTLHLVGVCSVFQFKLKDVNFLPVRFEAFIKPNQSPTFQRRSYSRVDTNESVLHGSSTRLKSAPGGAAACWHRRMAPNVSLSTQKSCNMTLSYCRQQAHVCPAGTSDHFIPNDTRKRSEASDQPSRRPDPAGWSFRQNQWCPMHFLHKQELEQ